MKQTRQETTVQAYVSPTCEVNRYGDSDVIRTSDIPVKWEWEWEAETLSE